MSLLRRRSAADQLARLDAQPVTSMADLDMQDRRQDIGLKRLYAKVMLAGLAGQILIADGVFIWYAWVGMDWQVPTPAIQVWLGATVVEVVSVVLVITRYLFPGGRDTGTSTPSE